MTTVRKPPIKTAELLQRLTFRYDANEYALFREVGDATGSNVRRHIDALAVSLWPSRGLTVTGFELKASRTDWLKELKNPAKAEAIAKYCDYFYLVVGEASIVQPGELPETWGLMVPNGPKGLKAVREAPKLEAVPLSRSFVAAIARRACAWEPAEMTALKEAHKRELSAEFGKGYDMGVKRSDPSFDKLQRLENEIERFAELTGIKIGRYRSEKWPESFGKAVNVIAQRQDWRIAELRKMSDELSTIVEAFETDFDIKAKDSE